MLSHLRQLKDNFVMDLFQDADPELRRNFAKMQRDFAIKNALDISNKFGRLPIFACDVNEKACKAFYVTGYECFWNFYSSLGKDKRCFYETLMEDLPCKLYLDIEGSLETNPRVDFAKVFDLLLVELGNFCASQLAILPQDLAKYSVTVLNSSRGKKFSKHLVVTFGDAYFKNNYHCGAFMRNFQWYILQKYGKRSRNPFYFWSEKETKFNNPETMVFFVDLGVYTKNRQFRLFGSSKYKKHKRYLWLDSLSEWTPLNHKYHCKAFQNIVRQVDDAFAKIGPKDDKRYRITNSIASYLATSYKLTETDKLPQSLKPIFFQCLIQYVADPTKVYNIVCTEHDGSAPTSSSLRNPSAGLSKSCAPSLDVSDAKLNTNAPLIHLLSDWLGAAGCFANASERIVKMTLVKGNLRLETNSRNCFCKKKIYNDQNAQHSKNRVFFIVHLNSLTLIQCCYNVSYCFDTSQNKKLYTKFGKITNSNVLDALAKFKTKHKREILGLPNRFILNMFD